MQMKGGPFDGWSIVPLATIHERQFATLGDITLREGEQAIPVAEVTGLNLYRQSNRYEPYVVVDYGEGDYALIALADGHWEQVRIRGLHIIITPDGEL